MPVTRLRNLIGLVAVFAIVATLSIAQGGETRYRIQVLASQPRDVADGLASQLSSYPDVEVVAEANGTYSVYAGKVATETEAVAIASRLESEGFLLANSSPQPFSTAAAQPVATPSPVPTSTPAPIDFGTPPPTPQIPPELALQEELSQLALAAGRAEDRGDLPGALDIWSDVKVRAERGTARWQEADEKIRRINQTLGATQPSGGDFVTPVSQSGGLPMGLIAGVVVGILVIGGAVFFVIMRGKKRDQQKLDKLKSSSGSPTSMGNLGIPAPTPRPVAQAKPAQPKQVQMPAQPGHESAPAAQAEVGPEARIRPGTVSPAAAPAPATPPAQPAPPAAKPPAAQPAAGATEESGVKLDFLFEEEPQPPADKPVKEDTTEFREPPAPDLHTPLPEGTPPPAPAPSADDFYAQDFESESSGAAPANWKGEYEYAALSIHDEGAGGGTKCLRFEKKQGVGSAYYSCRFPNATGRIGVEFDMRCDDKNKYLLGFYIEKDEDFRQSIHTIVHRTNSNAKPTLRLQNEATAYEFGKWAHIRFEIDLPRHIVDGYVDDKPVAMGTRLNNCPKYVNTLSIRDNLATTGSLLIDNIRIYRV